MYLREKVKIIETVLEFRISCSKISEFRVTYFFLWGSSLYLYLIFFSWGQESNGGHTDPEFRKEEDEIQQHKENGIRSELYFLTLENKKIWCRSFN